MPTENRSNDADGWIACDDGLHLIQMNKNLSHYGWVFRKINGGLPYSVREATAHEMAHALARQHLRIGVAQIAGQAPADPGEVERLRKDLLRWKGIAETLQVDAAKLSDESIEFMTRAKKAEAEVERLRADIETMRRKNNEYWHETEVLRAHLGIETARAAERDALLNRALPYLSNTPDLVQQGAEDLAEEIRSASAGSPCYGPNEWGTECGKCSKCKHASAEPSAPKCGNCGSGTGQACNDMGCGYLESGNGEPTAPVDRDEDVLTETLRTCEKWFVKHSPTAPLIGGFGDAEHPMLTCIRAALERKP